MKVKVKRSPVIKRRQNTLIRMSIRQPFAELILRGVKKIEYRSIQTHKRERVYIYASKGAVGRSEVLGQGQGGTRQSADRRPCRHGRNHRLRWRARRLPLEAGKAKETQEANQAQGKATACLFLPPSNEPGRCLRPSSPGVTSAGATLRPSLSRAWMPLNEVVGLDRRCSWTFAFVAPLGQRVPGWRSRSCSRRLATGG